MTAKRIKGEPRFHWLDRRMLQPPKLPPRESSFISPKTGKLRSHEDLHQSAVKHMRIVDDLSPRARAIVYIYGLVPAYNRNYCPHRCASDKPTSLLSCNQPEVLALARPYGTLSIDQL